MNLIADLLPSAPVLTAFTAACILLAVTPGPDMTLALGKTIAGGRCMGYAASLGASTGLLVHALFAGFGLSAILAASATAFTVIKILGAGYLLFLAYRALRHGAVLIVQPNADKKSTVWHAYLAGVGVNLTNPKVIMFYVTFLPQFVDAKDPHAATKLLFLASYFLVLGSLINMAIVTLAHPFVELLRTHPRGMRWFDYGFCALMSTFAAKLLLSGTK